MPAALSAATHSARRGRPPIAGVRQDILRAAEIIFTRHDFHEVLMEDVAQECGVGKGTLYRYFPSKRELYLAVMFEGIEALRDDLHAALARPGAPAEKIERIVRCILRHFWDRRFFFALIHGNEHRADDPEGREWRRRRSEIVDIVQHTLEEVIAAGHMRRMNARIAAEMLLGMVRGVNRYRSRHDALEDVVRAIVEVFWHGVALEPARTPGRNGGKRRRRMRVAILALIMGLCATAAVAQEAQPTVQAKKTLAECIAIALEQHPSLKAATASVEAGKQRVREAVSNYLPQITGLYAANRRQSSAAVRTGSQTTGVGNQSVTYNFYSTGVSFTQVLFDFGQNLNAIRSAQASEQSLQADRTTQREVVVLNVKEAYFNVLATRRLLTVADETVRQNEKHLEQAQGRFKVGLAAKFDVTQAQVQLANAQLNQVTARNNVAVARETLRNALGLTGPLDFDIVDNFDVHQVTVTEGEALKAAYDRRPELQSLRAQELAAIEQISSLQKNYLPNVTSNGNYQWSGSEYPLQSNWNIGAALNLSIFNGGLTTAQIGEQEANLSNLKYNEEVTRQNIALEVRQAVLNLEQAAESIRVSATGLRQARENLELAEGRYSTGVGNIIELTDAQASLTTAEANHVQALYNYKTTVAALEKATAEQLESE